MQQKTCSKSNCVCISTTIVSLIKFVCHLGLVFVFSRIINVVSSDVISRYVFENVIVVEFFAIRSATSVQKFKYVIFHGRFYAVDVIPLLCIEAAPFSTSLKHGMGLKLTIIAGFDVKFVRVNVANFAFTQFVGPCRFAMLVSLSFKVKANKILPVLVHSTVIFKNLNVL